VTAEERALTSAEGWRERAYRDRDDDPVRFDPRDPVERVAGFLYMVKYETAATAHGAVTASAVKGEGAIVATWARLEPVDRQLWRRRCADRRCGMTTREAVLAELAALERKWSHARPLEGGWLPFHVRYFRGGNTLPEVRAVKRETVRRHLRALTDDDASPVIVASLGRDAMARYRLDPLKQWPGEGVRGWYERLRAQADRAMSTEVRRAYDDALEAVRAQAE
jgi:hypothetical protein